MTESKRHTIGAILLAAGGSSRLGAPKQLLKYKGETLIRRAARTLLDFIYDPVVIVLGADAATISNEISGLPVHPVMNEEWAEGMGSSLPAGLKKLLELAPNLDGVLISLCDQPKVSREMLDRFGDEYVRSGSPVIAAGYNGIAGVPALFSRVMFDSLLDLKGDKGARQIITQTHEKLVISLPEAAFDIDTAADLIALQTDSAQN